ncbi:hypothetical protein Emag_001909 [Eimeria magna]
MHEQPAAGRPSGVAGYQQEEEEPPTSWELNLLQSLVSQDLLRFAPLLEAPAIAALGPSGPLTRLQVKDTKKSAQEAAALDFPEPPNSFTLSISSNSNTLQRIQLHRRPAIVAAFLNPKGRVLADAFIVWSNATCTVLSSLVAAATESEVEAAVCYRDNVAGSPRFLLDVDASVSERVLVYLEVIDSCPRLHFSTRLSLSVLLPGCSTGFGSVPAVCDLTCSDLLATRSACRVLFNDGLQRHAVSSSFAVSFEESFFALQLLPSIHNALSPQATQPPPVAPSQEWHSPEALKDDLFRQSFTFVRGSAAGLSSFRLLDTSGLPQKGAAAGAAPHSAGDAPGWIEGLIAADPRTWRLGYRVYLGPFGQPHEGLPHEAVSQHQSASALVAATGNLTSPAARPGAPATQPGVGEELRQRPMYEAYRRLSGVCEGFSEAGVGEQLPLSLNFDFLGLTCSHNKGCFVGQEVLTRALHQLSNRRRVAVLLKKDLCLPEDSERAPFSEASSLSSDSVRKKTPLEAWVPFEVIALWERALEAAAGRLLECRSAKTPKSADVQQDSMKQRIAAGDRLYRQTGAAAGEAGAWREIGHVLAFDEDVACGLCLLRSPPAEGPLKSPQDLATFIAALAGARLMVCKEKPPKELVLEISESKDEGESFLVVPPPYVIDALLAAPEAAASS